jgi:hypothetical protein
MDPLLTGIVVDVAKGVAEHVLEPAARPVWEVVRPILLPWWEPPLT